MTADMRKFGFRIQTRGGSTVDNLVIQGRDQVEAEKKLRQIYHHCTVIEAKVLAEPVPADSSDLEGVISLIAAEESPGEPPAGER